MNAQGLALPWKGKTLGGPSRHRPCDTACSGADAARRAAGSGASPMRLQGRQRGRLADRGPPAAGMPPQAAIARLIVAPITDGFSATVTPAADRISTFSLALSPKAEMIAPAWPMVRPLGAVRPAM